MHTRALSAALSLFATLLISSPSHAGRGGSADQPAPRTDANSKLAHAQMLANLKKGRIDVYFAGDSITRRWRATDYPQFLANWNENFFGWNAANFAWGGDRIQNILWRIRDGELDDVHPKVIVLLAGTNNVGSVPASDAKVADITKGIKALLDTMRKKAPKATIILMGILPRNDGPNPTALVRSINKINENISQFADGKAVRYLNINAKLADKDGKLLAGMTADRLHLSLKGYQVWADALKPLLTELLGPPAQEDRAPPPTGDPSATKKKSKQRSVSPSLPSQEAAGPLVAYVGTFSSPLRDVLPTQVDLPPGNGRGIHLFRVNRDTGEMTPAGVHEMGTSPSHLALNSSGTRLYSANETDRAGEAKEGTVSAFAIDRADGKLKPLNTVRSGGAGPTYVSVHPSGRFLLVANYFGGSVAVLPILADGRLGDATDVKKDAGKVGPTRATNAPPGSFAFSGHDRTHAHMIQADPSGRFVLHVDLGLDKIFVWKFDGQKGTLTAGDPPAVALPPGDGPRHFHFHPDGRRLYSIQEEGSTVVLFDYDAETGRLASRQTISTLPPKFAGSNFCSGILVSADGRFVYAGNRLHDTIGIFSVGAKGTLKYVGEEWTRGNYPRSFNFDPAGRFLYCCNQRGDNVAVFRVNRQTGGLTFTGQYVAVGNPSCIVFLDLAKKG